MGSEQSYSKLDSDLTTIPKNSYISTKNNVNITIFVKQIVEKDIGLSIATYNREYVVSKYNEKYDDIKKILVVNKYYLIDANIGTEVNCINNIVKDNLNIIEITIEDFEHDKKSGDVYYYYMNPIDDKKYSYLIAKRNNVNYHKIYSFFRETENV